MKWIFVGRIGKGILFLRFNRSNRTGGTGKNQDKSEKPVDNFKIQRIKNPQKPRSSNRIFLTQQAAKFAPPGFSIRRFVCSLAAYYL